MASRQWIQDLSEKDNVDEVYLVWQKNLLVAKNGRSYLNLVVGDKSGKVEGRVWSEADKFDELFQPRDLVRIKAQTIKYQDRLQLNIKSIEKIHEKEEDLSLFIPATKRSLDEMKAELDSLVNSIQNPHLRAISADFLTRGVASKKFAKAPAAKSIHHAWIGGLLEHTLSVCRLADSIRTHFDQVCPGLLDRDMVLAGSLLHDVGKTWELGETTFEYTDEGRLLGHLVLMYEAVADYIRNKPDFPPHLSLHLKHIILSHHGELEHGSPKRPQTAEAWAVHYADIIDARMSWLHEQFSDVKPGSWTRFQRQYDRYFWNPPAEELPGESVQGEIADGEVAKEKIVENKVVENKVVENKVVENTVPQNKVPQNKVVENNVVENNITENKVAVTEPEEPVSNEEQRKLFGD